MKIMQLEDLVGQTLMIGFHGTEATPSVIRLFREIRAGGLILFRRNFSSATGFKKLISDLEEALGRRLLIAVDHEGGRVIHLAEGVTVFPDNLVLGQTGNPRDAFAQGEIEAKELRRLGLDLNLAPTLDVLTEVYSPNIGIRSYGRDPERVGRLGAARIRGMQQAGLSACAKHFPGQGHSPLDAHLGLPVLVSEPEEMERVHLKPFRAAIEAGVHTVMSSHPVYPRLDDDGVPATFSRNIIHGILREALGFSGAILSDDLEMGALRNLGTIAQAAAASVRAGHDMLLICSREDEQRAAFNGLMEAYRNGGLDMRELEQSVERIRKLQRMRAERFASGETVPENEGSALAVRIAREGISKSAVKAASVFVTELPKRKAAVIFPRLSELAGKFFIESPLMQEEKYITGLLHEAGFEAADILIAGLEPSPEEIRRAQKICEGTHPVLFFCYDAHAVSGWKKLMEAVETAVAAGIIFLRDPYDGELLVREIPFVHAFGFRQLQIEAATLALLAPNREPLDFPKR